MESLIDIEDFPGRSGYDDDDFNDHGNYEVYFSQIQTVDVDFDCGLLMIMSIGLLKSKIKIPLA